MASATRTAAEPKHPIEQWLDSIGLEYDRVVVPLDSIDVERSRHNQARFESVNEDRVLRYLEAANSGAVFPPLVGFQKKNKVVIIDGNHRDEVARRQPDVSELPFFLVKIRNAEDVDTLTWSANTVLNGERLSLDERKAHAVTLAEQGNTYEEVALLTGLSKSQVQTAVGADRATRRAQSMRLLTDFSKLSEHQRIAADRIPIGAVFAAGVKWAANTSVTAESTIAAFKVLAKASSESEGLTMLEHERTVREEASSSKGKRRRSPSASQRALMHTSGLLKVGDVEDVIAATPTERRETLKSVADQAIGWLTELSGHLDKHDE